MRIAGIRGMNNIHQSNRFLADDSGIITPKVILNVDLTTDKVLTKRSGYTKLYSLTNAHSLSKDCSVLLCVSGNKLCKLDRNSYTELCDVYSSSMSYAEVGTDIYMSGSSWAGVYSLLTDEISAWGIDLPPTPVVSITSGDLQPGRYMLCYTRKSGEQIGGNGGIIQVDFDGDNRGILLSNFSESYLCWITDTNGKDLYLADVQNDVINQGHYNNPLPSLFVIPPPAMSIIRYAFGRIWGIKGKKLYYSEANAYSWFKEANSFSWPSDLVMIAQTQNALFVASEFDTWVLSGTDPGKMNVHRVGDGSLLGCPEYGDFQQSGQEIPTWRHKSVLPVWFSSNGFVVGNEHDYVTTITENRLKLTLGKKAAVLKRMVNGQIQILVSMPVPSGILGNVFKNGKPF